MTMSPRYRLDAGAWRLPAGKLKTSVVASLRRYFLFNARICASETSAIESAPRARRGATRRSQAASPGARTRRPLASVIVTARAAAIRELLVRLDDLLHELVAHDVALVEVDEGDAVDGVDDLHR